MIVSVDVVIHPREGRRELALDETLLVNKGVCTVKNAKYVSLAVLTLVSLLDDSPLRHEHGPKPLRVYRQFLSWMTSQPIGSSVTYLSQLADRLLTGLSLYGSEDFQGEFIPELLQLPIASEYLSWWRDCSEETLGYLLTFLRFLKKMRYDDESFQSTAFRKWEEQEKQLSEMKIDASSPEVSDLRRIVHWLCPRIAVQASSFKFGPGHVAERLDSYDQYSKVTNLELDHKISRVVFGTMTHASSPCTSVVSELHYYVSSTQLQYRRDGSTPTSRLKFVPKDTTTSRSICMEPNGYMWAQQGVLSAIVSVMEEGPMRRFVTLKDQTRNQLAARFGSEAGFVDTVDLSSASDSVHVDLVRAVFPKDWLYYLLGTRTTHVLTPRGEAVRVVKFAPMGSALCFPIQCIIFTACCLRAYMVHCRRENPDQDVLAESVEDFCERHLLRDHSHRLGYRAGIYQPITIYGDDIICDFRCTDDVADILSRLGFRFNHKKSFRGSQAVRESCGKYYCRGVDITPVTFKIPYFQKEVGPREYVSLISFTNQLYVNGLLNTRSYLIRFLRRTEYTIPNRMVRLPFTTHMEQFGIYTERRTSFERTRSNAKWCVTEEIQLHVRSVTTRNPYSSKLEAYLYLQNAAVRSRRVSDDPLDRQLRDRADTLRFGLRWTPIR